MRDNVKGGALTETTLFVLLAVYQPNHGYGIMQFIEDKTAGRLSLGAGTLYGAINTLVKKKWIVLHEEDSRKKEYVITEEGKRIVEQEVDRLKEIHDTALKIIGEGSHE
ncbi:DNA-binding PadR family transcriptional regulator [Clostridium tetanomorphum]|uniref:PadR family transcriptional regulator n=1 Tax=Clostridium tetanomorphum TaxID=1553 RepID=A0A923EE78_CLOTT|nr:helix-turn-helix transcriptional regulator [Clostridium tetanomorphum]KAJ49612.1 PadR family transcriptional regulator [Clostridium tetanomorphum DSM 665]KAJ52455.1 PadR family transcriptional regulator [Clostridium tetanomorphum DSM 665]MBC2400066.1 PadR family transcriptional regulator [Clostridium tetanomorphum]MBP1864702.1 DNA-binding PadR family transcriptional regulator [Clostridium tetanomorphum]NRS83880.1 DNA-binding PadR family transcriptional regulator [Clostridium tetanomorphum]